MAIDATNGTALALTSALATPSASSGFNPVINGIPVFGAADQPDPFGPATRLSLDGKARASGPRPAILDSATFSAFVSFGLESAAGGAAAPQVQRSKRELDAEKEAVELALSFVDRKKYEAARVSLSSYLNGRTPSGAVVHTQGIIELAARNYKKAEDLFRKAAYLTPELNSQSSAENAKALQQDDRVVLARAQRLLADPAERSSGVELLVALTDRSPEDNEARFLLAENLIRTGDAVNGLLQYGRVLDAATKPELVRLESTLEGLAKASPDGAFVRNLIGKTQLALGKTQLALDSLSQASELSGFQTQFLKDEAEAYVQIGREQLADRDFEAAFSSFDRAYELDPGSESVKLAHAEGLTVRGERLARFGDHDAAILLYQDAAERLSLVEGGDELRERIARSAYRAGRVLETRRIADGEKVGTAVDAFQVAYDLQSDNSTYRKKLAETRNRIGDEYLAEASYKSAADSYEAAFALEKNNTTYRDNVINANTLYGDERRAALDWEAAIDAYRTAFEADTDNTDSRFQLADTYNAAGLYYVNIDDKEQAAEYFLEALHLYPDNAEYQANYDSVKNYLT